MYKTQELKSLEINSTKVIRWDRGGPSKIRKEKSKKRPKKKKKKRIGPITSLAAAQSVFHRTAQKRLVEQHQEHLRDYK